MPYCTLLLPLLAHVLSHALRLLLSNGQDHELHANREGRKDKPSPPAVFLFSDCSRQGASEVMDEIGDVQSTGPVKFQKKILQNFSRFSVTSNLWTHA
jgi:hypothetical protein